MVNKQEIQAGPFGRLYQRFGDPTEELHESYDSWLADMSSRKNNKLEPFDFDLDANPEQSIYVPKVAAEAVFPRIPDSLYYNGFKLKLARSLGAISAYRLVEQLWHQPASPEDSTPLPVRLRANQQAGKNTLVVTSHINFQEFGYVKALRHVAKRDRHNIDKSGALFSKLMTRQKYKGKKLLTHFTPLGNVYYSSPKSESAELHGVPDAASNLVNALFKKVIKPDLEAGGMEFDAALAGSAVKPVKDEQGRLLYYKIPQVHPSSAKLVESFDDAVGITLVGPPLTDNWQMEVSEIYDVRELLKSGSAAEVTDLVYAGIRRSLEKLTKREVEYSRVSGIGEAAIDSLS